MTAGRKISWQKMMTSDERREVAERLRKHAGWLVLLGEPIGEDELDGNCENTGLGADYLADLIDPTCHVVPFDEESMRLPHCSRCGQPILKPWPNHCPNCGARVVRNDGD